MRKGLTRLLLLALAIGLSVPLAGCPQAEEAEEAEIPAPAETTPESAPVESEGIVEEGQEMYDEPPAEDGEEGMEAEAGEGEEEGEGESEEEEEGGPE